MAASAVSGPSTAVSTVGYSAPVTDVFEEARGWIPRPPGSVTVLPEHAVATRNAVVPATASCHFRIPPTCVAAFTYLCRSSSNRQTLLGSPAASDNHQIEARRLCGPASRPGCRSRFVAPCFPAPAPWAPSFRNCDLHHGNISAMLGVPREAVVSIS
jgi:hypothetical protein